MAEELRLVGGDVLDADAVLVAADFDDAVDQQERIAVRKRGEDFANPYGLKRLAAHVSSPLARSTPHRLPAPGAAGGIMVGHCAAFGQPDTGGIP